MSRKYCCWACSGEFDAVHEKTGYCIECQKIHNEVQLRELDRSKKLFNRSAPNRSISVGLRAGLGGVDMQMFMNESDWQDHLNPNEGCK